MIEGMYKEGQVIVVQLGKETDQRRYVQKRTCNFCASLCISLSLYFLSLLITEGRYAEYEMGNVIVVLIAKGRYKKGCVIVIQVDG